MKNVLCLILVLVMINGSLAIAGGFSTNPQAINDACLSVVKLEIYNEDDERIATGSGFVAFSNDLIVTNCHVIANAARIIAYSDVGDSYTVSEVLCVNSDSDVAIICFEAPTELIPLGLNESGEVTRASQVVAIGSPKGFANTVSKGNVSSTFDEDGVRYIQFNAPISSGSSGGALLNDDGLVIGITTATFDDGAGQAQNLNFAVNIIEVIELYAEHKDDNRIELADWKKVNAGSAEIKGDLSSARSFTLRNYAGFSISEVYLYPDGAASWGKARNTSGWLYKNSSMDIAVTDEEATLNTLFSLNFCFYYNKQAYYMEYKGLKLREILGRTITIYMENGNSIRIEIE